MATRQPVPDLLKGIAVITMIQVHIMEQFARPEILEGAIGKASLFLGGPFAAPVFMAVMGYFAGSHGSMEAWKCGSRGAWKRGMGLILLGILLNIGLNFNLLLHIYTGQIEADPLSYIFGADILPLAGLSLMMIGFFEMISRKKAIAAFILALAIAGCTPLIPSFPEKLKYLEAFIGGNAHWSYFPLFPWMAYPLVGYGWKRLEIEMPSGYVWIIKNLHYFGIVSLILLMATVIPAFKVITDLPGYYHHGIFLFGWIVVFLVACNYLAQSLIIIATDSQIMKYIKWLGQNVTLVYIIQWLIIGNLAFYFADSQYILQLILWFFGIILMTSCLTYLFLKIKHKWKTS